MPTVAFNPLAPSKGADFRRKSRVATLTVHKNCIPVQGMARKFSWGQLSASYYSKQHFQLFLQYFRERLQFKNVRFQNNIILEACV